ncbi:MAG: sigma-70 family RNA polymerase sigma factor [Actinomycetota bacterium]|nr:sigma-70 family RNA polymerase sigma factor [Actinomycetota bacterium]
MPEAHDVQAAVEEAHRGEWGLVLAATARFVGGDLSLAEEATQDAYVAALQTWGERGIPRRPGAWLTATARRKALDVIRRDAVLRRKLPALAASASEETADDEEEGDVIPDDRLRLVFTCCHPALAPEARSALTLRLVCGLSTAEIARAYLVPEATLAARITRAKKKIAATAIPYRVPEGPELAERTDDVLTVVHLVFTAGHTATGGDELVRADLVARSLDLARVLATLLPEDPEVVGLLALLELTDARREARVGADGELVLLEDQDRSRWDRTSIEHGLAMLDRGLRLTGPRRPPGRFLLQAALAAVHAEAATWDDTDWAAAVLLYDQLLVVWRSPVVALNRAVAVGFADGPAAGLAALDGLADEPMLARYHYLPTARAELLRRLGRGAEAAAAYRDALTLVTAEPERRHLERRLATLAE